MPDFTYLVGAETVEKAAWNMKSAAEQFDRSIAQLDQMLDGFLRRFEDLILRLEQIEEATQ